MAILFFAGRYRATDQANEPIAGAFLSFYAVSTTTFQPVYADPALSTPLTNPVKADANGLFPEIWGDDSLPPYKVVLASPDINDPTVPGSIIWSIRQYSSAILPATLAALLYPQTPAEKSSGVTPTLYLPTPPIDLLRYGAVDDGSTDNSAALTQAINVCTARGGGTIKIPVSKGLGYRLLTAPPTLSAPIMFEGEDAAVSFFSTPNDITILSFLLSASQSLIERVGFVGSGANGLIKPAVLFTDCNQSELNRVSITKFGTGVLLSPGGTGNNSSFLNRIRNSKVFGNIVVNIDAQLNTNALMVDATTFGGGTPIGLRVVDSNNLTVLGGDAEGCTTCAIDLDATSTLPAGHVITGTHLEGNNSLHGDIRIGNTATVQGVSIVAAFTPGVSAVAGINAVNCDGLYVRYMLGSGYASVPFLMATNLTNEDIAPLGPASTGLSYKQNDAKFNYADQSALAYAAPTSFDSSYKDSTKYTQYRIQAGSVVANKNYYAGLDVIEMTSTGSPGSGAKLYARAMIGQNDLGGATKVGAAMMVGDVDFSGGQLNLGTLGNYANDGAAATGGVQVGSLYRNGSVVQIRVT